MFETFEIQLLIQNSKLKIQNLSHGLFLLRQNRPLYLRNPQEL